MGTREHQSTFNNNGFKRVHVEYVDPVAQPETTVIPSFCILPKERQSFLYILLKNTVSYVDWFVKMEENHSLQFQWDTEVLQSLSCPGGRVLPYISYIGMCRPKGYGF